MGFQSGTVFFFEKNKRSADHPSLRGIRKLWLVFSWLYTFEKMPQRGETQLQTNQVYSKYTPKKKSKLRLKFTKIRMN